MDEQVEVLLLVGNIALESEDKRKVHAHVVLANRAGRAPGGHRIEGAV